MKDFSQSSQGFAQQQIGRHAYGGAEAAGSADCLCQAIPRLCANPVDHIDQSVRKALRLASCNGPGFRPGYLRSQPEGGFLHPNICPEI